MYPQREQILSGSAVCILLEVLNKPAFTYVMGSSILFDAEWLIIMFLKVLNCLIETVINSV